MEGSTSFPDGSARDDALPAGCQQRDGLVVGDGHLRRRMEHLTWSHAPNKGGEADILKNEREINLNSTKTASAPLWRRCHFRNGGTRSFIAEECRKAISVGLSFHNSFTLFSFSLRLIQGYDGRIPSVVKEL